MDRITYLITGANRGITPITPIISTCLSRLTSLPSGIGLGMTRALLLRPDTIVIATVRGPAVSRDELQASKVATGSVLIVKYYSPDEASVHSPAQLVKDIIGTGISCIDVVISNLGVGTDFKSCMETQPDQLLKHFNVNTIAPIKLFQHVKPLFTPDSAKFILISSALGSIGGIEPGAPYLAYGMSKAAANFFIRKLHFEEKGVVSVAIHPGWVRTENGQNFADTVGVEMPPMRVEESVEGVLKQVCLCSRA
jgi:norsolorinic acid ketoreductase